MATIGTFSKDDAGNYNGAIKTLSWNVEQASFRPVETDNAKGPDFRLFSGQSELGAAWKKTSRDDRPYLSVKLDDPAFGAPIYVSLIDADEGYRLVWSRPEPKSKAKAD